MNHEVFIAYHNHDNEIAKTICHVLEQNEIKCWMAPRDIPPCTNYAYEIFKALDSCKVVLMLFYEASSRSQWIKHEVNCMFQEQKKIIVFALDQTPLKGTLRIMLNRVPWIVAYPDYKTHLNELVLFVSHSLGKDISLENTIIKFSMKRKYNKLFIIGIVLLIIGVIFLLYLLFA